MKKKNKEHSTLEGLLRLGIAAGLIIFFFGFLSPRIVDSVPAMKHYGEVQDYHGVHSGLMYYTDLKTSQQTQDYVRHALETLERNKD